MKVNDNKDKIVSISKAKLSTLPAASYEGQIKVVDKAEEVEEALRKLRKAPLVGFDTETRPSFKKGIFYKVALLQLASEEECYLFRLNILGLTPQIIDFLEDPSILKIGLSLHDDFHNLNKMATVEPQGFVDLQQYVKDYLIADNSLSRIYGVVFGHRISKNQRLTNWEAPVLSAAQQSYASLDALACIRIYKHLEAGLFSPYSSPYLTDAPLPKPLSDEKKPD